MVPPINKLSPEDRHATLRKYINNLQTQLYFAQLELDNCTKSCKSTNVKLAFNTYKSLSKSRLKSRRKSRRKSVRKSRRKSRRSSVRK